MKKLFLVFLFLIIAGGSVLYYYWQQATKLPDWYTTQPSSTSSAEEFSNPSELKDAEARLQAKIEASIAKSEPEDSVLPPTFSTNSASQDTFNAREQQTHNRKNVEIELNNKEVNDLVMTTIAKQVESRQLQSAVPSIQTNIKEGKIETGAVVNLSSVPKNQLPKSETALVEKALKTFPFLENQKIYVGISGQPRIENGQVKLDQNTKIKLGDLSFSVSELAQRLNVPQEQLEQKLNRSLQLGSLKVNDIELIDNKVRLKGSVVK